MKYKRQLSGSCFGPRSHMSTRQKVANGLSVRKHASRFGSKRMNDINEEVKRRQVSMQSTMGIRKYTGVSNASHMHGSKTLGPSKKFETSICKSNYNVKDQQHNTVLQVRQAAPKVSNNGQSNASAPFSRSGFTSTHPSARNMSKWDQPNVKDLQRSTISQVRTPKVSNNSQSNTLAPFARSVSTSNHPSARNVSKRDHPLAPVPKHMDQPSKSSRFRNALSSEQLEKHNTFRSKNDLNSRPEFLEPSQRPKAKQVLVCDPTTIGSSGTQLNHLKSMPQLVHRQKNIDMHSGSRSKGRTEYYQQDIVAGKYCTKNSETLKSERVFTKVSLPKMNSQPNGCDKIAIDVKSKKRRKEPLLEENPVTHDDIDWVGTIQHVNQNRRPVKKWRRYIETNDCEDADSGAQNPIVVEADVSGLKGCHATVLKCVEGHCYCCSKPIDEPIWTGIFKTGSKEYISLAGHRSTKSGDKVWELSKSLQAVVELTKLPRLKVWPKKWEASIPTDDNIGLYFFSHKMRPDENLDQLVKELMENDLALRAVIGEAEMLIFPSILLPKRYHRFQTKHYLWGSFKPKKDESAMKMRLEHKAPEEARQGTDPLRHVEHNTEATAAAANAKTTVQTEANEFVTGAASTSTEAKENASDAPTDLLHL